jgi:type IV pilus assembly protein PilM
LQKARQISKQAAETFKVTQVLDGKRNPQLEALLRPTAESLAEEIRRTLSLYGAMASEEGIRTVYVSGGGAKVPGLCPVLAQILGVPVQVADPFRGFRVNKKIDPEYLAESAPLLAVGVGLAIRRPGDK